MTTIDRSRQEITHRYPTFLPDGRHFLYSIMSGEKETRGVYLGSLDGAIKRRLLDDGPVIKYVAAASSDTSSGVDRLIYGRDGALLAQPFDWDRLQPTGERFLLSDKVGSDSVYIDYSTFSVSDNGVLVFDPNLKRQRRQYRWVDRRGQPINSLDVATGDFGPCWSRDGRFIIYHQIDPKTKADVWVLPAAAGGEAKPLVCTEANEAAGTLSPNGRWLAYVSDVSGRFEVYVQSFPEGGGKQQVSTGGGAYPRRRRDGRELFYYAGDGNLMAVQVRSGESFEVGAAVPLFDFRAGTLLTNLAPYVVTADGQRFLINAVVDTELNAPLTVVVNWAADLKK